MAVPSATRAESFHLIEFAQFELIALNELDVINWIIDPQCVVYGWQLATETGSCTPMSSVAIHLVAVLPQQLILWRTASHWKPTSQIHKQLSD